MTVGFQTVEKSGAAWLASLAFCLVYLVSLLQGAGPVVILTRAFIAAVIAFFIGRLLMRPLTGVFLDVLAEHQRRQEEEQRKEEEEAEA